LHQVGTSSLLTYMMHGHTYIKSEYTFLALSDWQALEIRKMLPLDFRLYCRMYGLHSLCASSNMLQRFYSEFTTISPIPFNVTVYPVERTKLN